MTDQAGSELRMSAVVKRLVLDLETTEDVGRVGHLLVDEKSHQVMGISCRVGMMGRERYCFRWDQIASVGKDSVILKGGASPWHPPETVLPLAELELWSDAGERIGRLVDFEFDRHTQAIQRYLFTPEGWRGLMVGLYAIDAGAIISAGRRRMMIRTEAVENPPVVDPDWSHPSVEFPHEEFDGLRQDWQAARQHTQAAAEQFQGEMQARTRQFAHHAKDQVGQVLGRFRKQTRKLRSQLRETVTDLSEEFPVGRNRPSRPRRTIDVNSRETWTDDSDPNSH